METIYANEISMLRSLLQPAFSIYDDCDTSSRYKISHFSQAAAKPDFSASALAGKQ